jgi:preprotein translocase subunit SecF
VIHDFSFAMLVGVVFGTYSSVFVASSLALETQLYLERVTPGRKK